MSRRVVYLSLGAVAALLAVLRAAAAAQLDTSEGGQEQASGPSAGAGLSAWWAEVQAAAAEREEELRTALGLDGTHDLVDADLPGDRL